MKRTVTPATILQIYDNETDAKFAMQVLERAIEDLKATHTVVMRIKPGVRLASAGRGQEKAWVVRARVGFDQIRGDGPQNVEITTRSFEYEI